MSTPRPGRRIADLPVRRAGQGTVVAVVLLVLAVVLVLLAGSASPPDDATTRAKGALVNRALDACPRFDPPGGTSTSVSLGSGPVRGLGDGGSIRYGALGEDVAAAEPQDLARGEVLRVRADRDASPALAVTAVGRLAAGLFAFQTDTRRDDATAVTPCPSPRAGWWFTGAGATLDHTSELVLSNVDPGPAVVDVRMFGPDGEVETLGTRGITIPPAGSTTLDLTDVAPQTEELAVSVVASRGRVVAAVSDSFAPGIGAATGVEWIPAQRSAGRIVHLPGLPARADDHTLVLANPSGLETLVDVEVSGETGSFAPAEDAQVRVPPGAVVTTDLSGTVGRDASAVTLRSRVPVTATVRSEVDGDTSYAGGVRWLTGPAVAPVLRGTTTKVQLSAGERAATATATGYDESGKNVGSTTLDIPAGATATWSPRKKAAYVMVTPGEGRILGAVTYAGSGGSSQVSLEPLVLRVERPVVSPAVH